MTCSIFLFNKTNDCSNFFNFLMPKIILNTLYNLITEYNCTKKCQYKDSMSIILKILIKKKIFFIVKMIKILKERYDIKKIKCISCKMIIKFLIIEMAKPSFRNKLVKDGVYYLCSIYPKKLLYFCRNLFKGIIPVVLSKILQKINDKNLCYVRFFFVLKLLIKKF